MGLLDNLGGIVSDVLSGREVDLMSVVQRSLSDMGGVDGLLQQLNQSGMGPQVASWLGSGSNLPVSVDQIQAALGGEQLTKLAQSFGVDVNQVASLLADHLPAAVDKASPDGSLEI